MQKVDSHMLKTIADLHDVPQGAYNIRKNGESAGRASTENITIESKKDKPGIDITVKAGTKNESVHIPVIITETGVDDLVYNDFYIGEDADVLIVAGCGIHNSGDKKVSTTVFTVFTSVKMRVSNMLKSIMVRVLAQAKMS